MGSVSTYLFFVFVTFFIVLLLLYSRWSGAATGVAGVGAIVGEHFVEERPLDLSGGDAVVRGGVHGHVPHGDIMDDAIECGEDMSDAHDASWYRSAGSGLRQRHISPPPVDSDNER
eukprot:NODE_2328_length_485_cov_758.658257_g1910_i0.p1 GENE.NODE_2328_length_485_cov_758.658257_g1910_i0~~NODE_2328_length_485_cov_758.658257_g1910_i0.p1  ORF type:complete len:123 (+),score=26.66 NODE_2328_length_485_cov_758.658257_g1910_i0:23-370(+)